MKDYPPYLDYPKERKPQNNYDLLISKTPEELAEWLDNLINYCYYGSCVHCFMCEACQTSMMAWLKSPVEVQE